MRKRRGGFTLLEVLVVLAIVMVLASMAIPNLQRSRTVADETAAVESLTTLNNQSFIYWTEHDGYPRQLIELWPEATIAVPADASNPGMSTTTKIGYVFTYRPGPIDSTGKIISYSVTATPISPGASGVRSFFTDQSGPIRVSETGEATADSPSISQGAR
jgi:type IV pilus assembly protein PilA